MLSSLLLFLAGILCLATAWYFSHHSLKTGSGTLLARGLIHKAEKQQEQSKSRPCTLTVSFTLKNGKIIHHQEIKSTAENWYPGMPVLVQYRMSENEPEIQAILSFRQAYGNAFIAALLGILLVITGALFF